MLFKLFFLAKKSSKKWGCFSATVLQGENIPQGVCLSIPLETSQFPVLPFFGCLQAKNTMCTIKLLPVATSDWADRCSQAALVEMKAPQTKLREISSVSLCCTVKLLHGGRKVL